MKKGGALGGGVALGQPLEGVKQHVVGIGDFVRREIALKHAPVWAELLNAVVHIRSQGLSQLLRSDWLVPRMPVKAVSRLAQAAQFHVHVGAFGDGGDALPPDC